MAVAASELRNQLHKDGFVVIRNLLAPAQLEELREAAAHATSVARAGQWPHVRTVGKQFPPWEFTPEKGIWGVQGLLDPDMPGSATFARSYFCDEILGVAKELMSCEDDDLVMELYNMLVRPESDFSLCWHRDDIPPHASAEQEMERLNAPEWHTQWNLALFQDESLVVVPGSHARPRTEVERAADPHEPQLPDQLVVGLGPGDVVFYNNNILHRGVYDSQKERMSLHGSVGHVAGSRLRARNVLQHGVGKWVHRCDFEAALGKGTGEGETSNKQILRAENMREKLVKLGSESGDVGFSLKG